MAHALGLVKKGFATPVPFLEVRPADHSGALAGRSPPSLRWQNHSPVGRAMVRLFSAMPDVAARGSYLAHLTQSGVGPLFCPKLTFGPGGGHAWHPRPVPPGLSDVIAGTRGFPPGPDVNEVSGRSLQDEIKGRNTGPAWGRLIPPGHCLDHHQ